MGSKLGKERWWKLRISMAEAHASKSEKKAQALRTKILKKGTDATAEDWDEASLYKEKVSKYKKRVEELRDGATKEQADKAEKKAKAKAHEKAEKSDEKKRKAAYAKLLARRKEENLKEAKKKKKAEKAAKRKQFENNKSFEIEKK